MDFFLSISQIEMRFASLVKSLATGVFASFSADTNHHAASCTSAEIQCGSKTICSGIHIDASKCVCPGMTVYREYECAARHKDSTVRFMTNALQLAKWHHTQVVEVLYDTKARVTDVIAWSHCSAKRQYLLSEDPKTLQVTRTDLEDWVVNYDTAAAAASCAPAAFSWKHVQKRFKKELCTMDWKTFKLFTARKEHDSDGDGGSAAETKKEQFDYYLRNLISDI